ncbi:MAG: hypothetical protein R3325_04315 [Thermoanaerobaculia bacterium]|nr:hypothetical protein [Thermoanaerobaculia bacterium]
MLRKILAAILGYVVIVVIALAGIGVAWMILGGEGAFRGEGPEPSTPWIALNVIVGFLAALVAGWTARRVGRSSLSVNLLIGIVLVLGLLLAAVAQWGPDDRPPVGKPVAEMSFTEAGEHARQPDWYNWVIPLVGAAGVCLGGRRRDGG